MSKLQKMISLIHPLFLLDRNGQADLGIRKLRNILAYIPHQAEPELRTAQPQIVPLYLPKYCLQISKYSTGRMSRAGDAPGRTTNCFERNEKVGYTILVNNVHYLYYCWDFK